MNRRIALLVVAAAAALCAVFPTAAYAKDYRIASVDIDATVDEAGYTTVIEERTFDFDGDFHYTYWDLPLASSESSDREVLVIGAGERPVASGAAFSDEGYRQYMESSSGAAGTYQVLDISDGGVACKRVRVSFDKDDESAVFRIVYMVRGDVAAWEDCGELYWKYVTDGWEVASENVTCTVHLPVPDGERVTAGGNVCAWQHHAPLTGEVRVDGCGDVVGTVPCVESGDFAELRVVFPVEWLGDTSPTEGERLQRVMDEEASWADMANERRSSRIAMAGGIASASLGSGVVALAIAFVLRRRWKRDRAAAFSDEYFRDVPSGDHPAVIDCLWDGSEGGEVAMAATLVHLDQEGAVRIERADFAKTARGGSAQTVEDFRLTRVPERAAACENPIDRELMALLFDWIGALMERGVRPRDENTMYFTDIAGVAKANHEEFASRVGAWNDVVKEQVEASRLNRGARRAPLIASALVMVLALVAALAFIVAGSSAGVFSSDVPGVLPACVSGVLVLFGAAALSMANVMMMRKFSAETVELNAKLKALKHWFEDFTDLGEAVSQDVSVWNRLMVMAVILDCAPVVAGKLKDAVSAVAQDPSFAQTMLWCDSGAEHTAASSVFMDMCSAPFSSASGS